MVSSKLTLGELEPATVFDKLVDKGVTKGDAAKIVGEWILKYFGQSERRFTYSDPLEANKPGCVNTFQQQFHHQDWVDGVSVVQASKTPGEDGFNDRLHRIEDDLAALSKEITKSIQCTANLRKEVSTALEEVKNELNRLNHDVFQLVNRVPGTGGGIVGGINTGTFLGTTDFLGDRVTVWRTPDGYLTLPAVHVLGADGGLGPKVNNAAELSKFIHTKPEVKAKFSGKVSVKDFEEQFGEESVEGGPKVKEVLETLPKDAEYESLDALVKDAAERSAAVIKATNTTDAVVANTFTELGKGVEDIGNTAIERFDVVPTEARTALVKAGIDTVAKLADTNPTELQTRLARAGVSVTAGDTAAWTGTAMTLNFLGGRR